MKNIGIASLLFNSLVLAGCAGGNAIDEAVPQAAFGNPAGASQASVIPADKPEDAYPVAPPAADADPVFSGTGRANLTGTYPNINREPRGAVAQLTDEQREAMLAEMQALALAHSKGEVSSAEYNRRLMTLRRLAATHSDEVIQIIEN